VDVAEELADDVSVLDELVVVPVPVAEVPQAAPSIRTATRVL
jgi:hypothetical protein